MHLPGLWSHHSCVGAQRVYFCEGVSNCSEGWSPETKANLSFEGSWGHGPQKKISLGAEMCIWTLFSHVSLQKLQSNIVCFSWKLLAKQKFQVSSVSVACMRNRVNSVLVLRPEDCGSMFAGQWDHQSERVEGHWNMSRQSKKQTVYSTCWESATFSPRRICLFSPLKISVLIESNTNRNICSMENTKIKARRACKLLFAKKQAKEKCSWGSVEAPYILYVFPMVTNRRQDCLEPESRCYAKMT